MDKHTILYDRHNVLVKIINIYSTIIYWLGSYSYINGVLYMYLFILFYPQTTWRHILGLRPCNYLSSSIFPCGEY